MHDNEPGLRALAFRVQAGHPGNPGENRPDLRQAPRTIEPAGRKDGRAVQMKHGTMSRNKLSHACTWAGWSGSRVCAPTLDGSELAASLWSCPGMPGNPRQPWAKP